MGDFQIYNKNKEELAAFFEPKLTNIYMIFGLVMLYVIVISWYIYVVITVVIS